MPVAFEASAAVISPMISRPVRDRPISSIAVERTESIAERIRRGVTHEPQPRRKAMAPFIDGRRPDARQ